MGSARLAPISKTFLLCGLLLAGCATPYESTALRSWDKMRSKRIDEAIEDYEKNVTSDKEKLLRLMDEGILLRVGERFKESNLKFAEAARIIEQNGYLSLGEQGVSLLINEKQTTYQGEEFEKVLVHLYMGLNYLSLNESEEALVEMRRVNEILYKMIYEGKRPYELNAFARYLGGNLFENDSNENDAYVAYKNVLKLDPELDRKFEALKLDLIRIAKRGGFSQDFEELKKKFGAKTFENASETLNSKSGAVTFIFEAGKSPLKYSSREKHFRKGTGSNLEVWIPVTYYRTRPYRIHSARISIEGQTAVTTTLNDIEDTAIRYLKDRMGRMVAKAILSAGIKAGIAVGVAKATDSKELGLLTGLALFLASEADTRSWLLLPAQLQIAKIFVKPGTYNLKVDYLDGMGAVDHTEIIPNVVIKAQRATFIQRRSFD